jgi:hypothetical protein
MTKEEMLKDDFVATHYGDRARNWVDTAFIDGAEWMQEKMIEKATEWLKEKCCSFWIEDFKQAMEE